MGPPAPPPQAATRNGRMHASAPHACMHAPRDRPVVRTWVRCRCARPPGQPQRRGGSCSTLGAAEHRCEAPHAVAALAAMLLLRNSRRRGAQEPSTTILVLQRVHPEIKLQRTDGVHAGGVWTARMGRCTARLPVAPFCGGRGHDLRWFWRSWPSRRSPGAGRRGAAWPLRMRPSCPWPL